jgi:hypothetical protein
MSTTQKELINAAAAPYLSEQDEGDLYDAFLKLEGEDPDDFACNHVNMWEPLMHLTVGQTIELINSGVDNITDTKSGVEKFIDTIDFTLLREQKSTLIGIFDGSLTMEDAGNVDGIINLIDALQDYAVDVLGRSEEEVFNFSEDDSDF